MALGLVVMPCRPVHQTSDFTHVATAATGTVNRITAGVSMLSTGYTPFTHLLVVAYMCIRELSLWLQQDGDCKSCKCKADKYSGYNEKL